jgi:hypothetical protein
VLTPAPLQRQRRTHVSADRISRDRHPAAVHAEVTRMRGGPLQRCVAFFELRRISGRRQRSVFDEHTDLARADDEITQQPLMVLEIADDPDE